MNNKIKTIKFQDFTSPTEDFLYTNKIDSNMWESILAYLASLTKFQYTQEGLIDSRVYISDNFPGDRWHIGLYYFLMSKNRGDIILGQQVKEENLPYCGLVPLVLAAHKKYNDIPYSKWSLDGLNIVVNTTLYDVMKLRGTTPDFDPEYLVEVRDIGLVVKTGSKAGTKKNPRTNFGLSGITKISHPIFASLPKMAQVLLTQTWAAHPDNRNKYMVLDINDWDNIPEPLESSNIFEEDNKPNALSQFNGLDLPWKF